MTARTPKPSDLIPVPGDTPVMTAIRNGESSQLQKILQEEKPDLSIKNKKRQTALDVYKSCYPEFFSEKAGHDPIKLDAEQLKAFSEQRRNAIGMYACLQAILNRI